MNKLFYILFFISTITFGQNFTYSGYIYNSVGIGVPNVGINLYKRTTPTLNGFTSQTNFNGHSYYRSTGSMTWTDSKIACENMGGHLVTISNSSENNFVFNTWPSGWIGYYQDKVSGYTYSEPSGGFRWTENKVTSGLISDYDVSSYTSGSILSDIVSSINTTLYNSPSYVNTGGKYLTFNGINQYAITDNLASKFIDKKISIVTWIYPTGNGVILSELNIGSPSSGWHESVIEITGSNTLRVGFWNGSGITQLNTPITLNTWNMVTITYDGTTLRGFLNNINFGNINFNRQAAFINGGNGRQHFAFGLSDTTNMGHGGYGNFRLGVVQFFNRVLTTDEIDRSFNLYTYRYRTNQYTNWNGGEPNNSGGEDYTQFVSNGKWNDLPNVSLPYVLEFDYIVTFTDWVLIKTIYTDSNGRYVINETTNPSVEWYLQIETPTLIQPQIVDAQQSNTKIISRNFNSLDYYKYDVNNDGRVNISDTYYIFMRKSGRFNSWGLNLPNIRFFTPSQFSIINTSSQDLRVTYPGLSNVTINSPVNGGTSNFYLITTGKKD